MKPDAIDHPKLGMLCRALRVDSNQAIGILYRLWRFTALHAPNGHIGRWTRTVIAEACQVHLDRDTWLIEGLLHSRLVDLRSDIGEVVHDWPQHCSDQVHLRLARTRSWFWDGTPPRVTRLPHGPLRDELEHYYATTTPPPLPGQAELFLDASAVIRRPTRSATPDYKAQFEQFWTRYPKKVDRKKAERAWCTRLRPSDKLFKHIMDRLQEWITYSQLMRKHGEFTPEFCGPCVYINNERWEDVYELPPRLQEIVDATTPEYPTDEEIALARAATTDNGS